MTQHAVNFHRWIFVLAIIFSAAVTNGKSLKQARRYFFKGFLFHLFFVPINLARSSFRRDELWFCDSLEQIHKCGRANEERWAALSSGLAFFLSLSCKSIFWSTNCGHYWIWKSSLDKHVCFCFWLVGTQLQSKSCTNQQASKNRNAFSFRTFRNVSSLENCVDLCCGDETCELAILSKGFHCFGVSCFEPKVCHRILDRLLMDDEREIGRSSRNTGKIYYF